MNNKDFLSKKYFILIFQVIFFFFVGRGLQWIYRCCKLIPNRFINSTLLYLHIIHQTHRMCTEITGHGDLVLTFDLCPT